MMPTVKRITAIPYDIPLKNTLKWGKGHELARLQHVLIKIELSDGTVGIAEATPRPTIYGETQSSVIHIVEQHLAPMLVGQSINDFESVAKLSSQIQLIKSNNTAKGALDMALHHAAIEYQGNFFRSYLGISPGSKIRVSYIVSTGATEGVISDVGSAYGAGVRVFKIKIGKDILQEIETIKQLIAQFPSAEFYVDANQCLTVESGAGVLNELVELGVIHCEEALPVFQIKERYALRQQTTMPIIADDSAFTVNDLQREIDFDTFDILNIKTPRTGFTVSNDMLHLAIANKKGVMVGSQASSLLGCLYAAMFAGLMGIDYATECSFFLKTDVDLTDAPQIVDGWINLDDVQDAIDALIPTLI
jgi:L-Ala-D/L-Glu epimerase